MPAPQGSKQLNIPIPDELKEAIKQYCDDHQISQADFARSAIQAAMDDDYKQLIPSQADAIDLFRSHVRALEDCYRSALDASVQAYDIAAADVKSQLDGLKALTEMTQRQQTEIDALKAERAKMQAEIESLRAAQTETSATASEIDRLRKELTESRELVLSLRERHAAEVDRIKAEGFAQLIEIVKAQQGQ